MSPDREPPWLIALGAGVADGAPVDWDAADRTAQDVAERDVLRGLRRVSGIVMAHRTLARGREGQPVTGDAGLPIDHWQHLILLERAGTGAFGTVYRAWDTRLERQVAVKLLPVEGIADRSPLHEARLLARIRHENVVTVHGADEDGTFAGIWMEFIHGSTIGTLVAERGPMSAREAAGLGIDLCRALSALHGAGLVHRDIKAHNVMREVGGRTVLMDFSGAQLVVRGEATDVSGTPLYMAPELFDGTPASVKSDLYSLGVLLFFVLCGEHPVEGRSIAELREQHRRGLRRRLLDVRPDADLHLARTVDGLLAPDPAARVSSPALLAEELAKVLEIREEARSGRRRTLWRAGAAAAVTLALAAAGFALRSRAGVAGRSQPPLAEARLARVTQLGNAGTVTAVSEDGRYLAFALQEGRQQGLWLAQTGASSRVALIPPSPMSFDGVTFHPDGQYIYYTAYTPSGNVASLYSIPVLGGTPERLLDDVDTAVTFSPDGRRMAYLRNTLRGSVELRVAGADGSDDRLLAASRPPREFDPRVSAKPDWSPDGRTIAVPVTDGARARIELVDAASGALRSGSRLTWDEVRALQWMPNGKELVAVALDLRVSSSRQIWLVNPFEGGARRVTSDFSGYNDLSLSRDGRLLTSVRVDERSNLWVAPLDRPADASQVTFGADRVDGATGLAWTPGGRLVYTSLESGNPDLWLVDASGGGPRQLTRDPAGDHRPVVTPDGRRIIFVSSRDPAGTCLWSVDVDGRAPKRLSDGPADGFPLVAPGAQTILFTSFAGPRLVRRLSLDTGATAGTQSGDAAGVAPPGFAARAISSDGASLVGWHYDSGRRGYGLTVVDLADGRLRPLGLTQFPPGPIAWVPGKDEFLYVDPNDASIWRRSAAGGPAARLTEPRAGRVYDLSVSPDGTRLALARGETLRNVVTMTVLPR